MIRGREGRGPAVRDLRPRGSSAWPVQGDPAATPGDEPCHGSALYEGLFQELIYADQSLAMLKGKSKRRSKPAKEAP
jgi:hypothetical protein